MPAPYADSVTFTIGGNAHEMTRSQVEAAASRLTPAHGATALSYSWYALIGGGIFYVGALVKEATGAELKVEEARVHLHDLGFQIMAFMWIRDAVTASHPCHR